MSLYCLAVVKRFPDREPKDWLLKELLKIDKNSLGCSSFTWSLPLDAKDGQKAGPRERLAGCEEGWLVSTFCSAYQAGWCYSTVCGCDKEDPGECSLAL